MSMEMNSSHEVVVIDMISRSFAEKGDLTTLAQVTYDDLVEQVEVLWEKLLEANLSFVIIDKSKNQDDEIIGACLNFDARSEEAEPLCACARFSREEAKKKKDEESRRTNLSIGDGKGPGIKDDVVDSIDLVIDRIFDIDEKRNFNLPKKDDANSRSNQGNAEKTEDRASVVEFLQTLEEPLKDEYLPKPLGKTIYTSLLGTSAKLAPGENVKVKTILCACRYSVYIYNVAIQLVYYYSLYHLFFNR